MKFNTSSIYLMWIDNSDNSGYTRNDYHCEYITFVQQPFTIHYAYSVINDVLSGVVYEHWTCFDVDLFAKWGSVKRIPYFICGKIIYFRVLREQDQNLATIARY